VYAQVTFAGEVARAGYQSHVELQAEPYVAQASGMVEKVVSGGGDIAVVRERRVCQQCEGHSRLGAREEKPWATSRL
jgi:hypothetical protein